MRARPLGDTSIAAVGLGDVSLARAAARGVDPSDVERCVSAAIEAGLNLVDISADADSEHVVGDAIRSLRARDRVIAAARVPAIVQRVGVPTRDVLPERLPARYLQERIEATLRQLRLDAVPLAQLPLRSEWRASRAW